jgi:hypothetical protein
MELKTSEVDINFDDIKRNDYVFTDGCGQVAANIA